MTTQRRGVFPIAILLLLHITLTDAHAASSRRERDARQAELDAQCQTAREKILSVERAGFIEDCVQSRPRPDRAGCERFYADHGTHTGGRAPLHMNLPECVVAHEFRENRGRR